MSNVISIALIIASLGVFFGYINPTYNAVTASAELKGKSIRELTEERDHYADALSKTREIEKARTGLLGKYNAIPLPDRERLEKLLPDHIDSVRLIIDVNNIASQYGMTLKNITLTDSGGAGAGEKNTIGPQEDRWTSVGLKFNISGSYDSFRSFLRDLEMSLRLVDIRTLVFNAQESDVAYLVTLSTYKLNYSAKKAL